MYQNAVNSATANPCRHPNSARLALFCPRDTSVASCDPFRNGFELVDYGERAVMLVSFV